MILCLVFSQYTTAQDVAVSASDSTVSTQDTSSFSVKEQSSDIKTTIKYNARDSIRFNVQEQKVYLYGDAWVDYGDMKLDADLIHIDWTTGVITATYQTDSSGKQIGIPHFEDRNDAYEAEKIVYNYKTGKGYISEIVTSDGEGFLRGSNANKDADDNLLIKGAMYTTCNRKDPCYHFKLRKTKVVDQKKIYTNYFNLYIDEVPTPLGLPFGIFPMAETRSSGIIIPTWGDAASRGFFLRDGGYYWAISDYVGVKFLGEIYSNGGWGTTGDVNYKKRYSYKGNLRYSYRDVVRRGDEYGRTSTKDYQLRWRHNPESRGGRTFSANVNYASSSFYSNTTTSVNNYLASSLNSTIRYYMPIKGTPFNVSVNLRHDQNNQTGIVNMNLPDVNLSMNRINPFKSKNSTGRKSTFKKFYESINLQYAFDMRNKLTNAPRVASFPFDVANAPVRDTVDFDSKNFGFIWDNRETGMKHNIPISGSMKLGPFSLNGNFNYTEYWYPKSYDYAFSDADTAVEVNEIAGFDRTFAYSGGVTMNTNIYGMYSFKGKRNRQIRHTMRPNIGWRMSPDYQANQNVFRTVVTDTLGTERTISKFNGLIFSAPSSSRVNSMTFSIQNTLEMKHRLLKDTADNFKKTKLIENFSVSSNYNFAADSFNLAKINLTANTNFFNLLNVNYSATIDPYSYVSDENSITGHRRVNQFAINEEGRLGNTESWSLALSTNLNSKAFRSRFMNQNQKSDAVREMLDLDPANYVDFNIPWSLNIRYTYRETQIGLLQATATQSLQFNGDVKLSKSWKVGYGAAYDFEEKEIVTPRLNFYKDLHCWEMRFTWVPYGPAMMYEFYINVKASVLQDLKWSRRNSFYDR